MDRDLIADEDFAAEAHDDAIALELERRDAEAVYDDYFDVPEYYEPSPYDGTYSEM